MTGIGVFVLGMHRSGTSAATRAINLLGVPVGSDDELKPPSPNNPAGFWEVKRLTDFNNELLAELGGSSLAPPPLESGWGSRQELEQRRERARRLHRKTHRTEQWVWKDPRNCVLFGFWREALDVRPVVVLMLREPADVARSLEARQGLSAAMAFAVWERYLREALVGVEGLPVFIARYRDLVEEPERWSREVGSFLRDQGVACDPEDGAGNVAEFIATSPRAEPGRSESAPAEPASTAPEGPPLVPSEPQRQLLATLESLAGRHNSLALAQLPRETEWVEPLLAERRAADVFRRQMDERQRVLRRRMRAARSAQAEADRRLEEARRSRRPGLRSVTRRLPRRRRADGHPSGRGTLPDFLIIGGQKCGTSSLFRYLGLSPYVVLPNVKEVHYFDLHYDRGIDWYRSQLPATDGGGRLTRRRKITGEASPYYMFHPLTPQRIREMLPDVRLIALLRDPSRRAVSHYYHEVGNGHETLPLPAALEQEDERLAGEAERIAAEPGYVSFNHRHFSYQARGVYIDQLSAWREVFPQDQLLVINSDRFFRDPRQEMWRVYRFLGLPGRPPSHYSHYNVRPYPSAPVEVEARLRERFAEPNARLYEWLGEDFGWNAATA
jgi:hypothetical protein